MKICDVVLDTVWYDPRVRKQLIRYCANGHDVVAVGLMDSKYDLEKINALPCKVNVVDYKKDFWLSIPIIKNLVRKVRINNCIKNKIIDTNAELIHANDLTALIPAYFAAKKMKAALVYDAHEINTENYSRKRKVVYSALMKFIEQFLVKRVDLMVSVSNAAAEYFRDTYKINKPLVVTNCAMKDDIQCVFQDKVQGFEVLNHGQFYNGRGYDIMVQACKYLNDYPEIALAIRGYGELEAYLREEAKKLENKKQFVFYPPVDTKELITYASKSHVGVAITEPISLNFKFSISNKIFEYAAAGLPVIMSDIPEHRYLNDKYKFGIVLTDNSPKQFADAVIKLYKDRNLYKEFSENAIRMSQDINWEKEFDKLLVLEKKILKEKF